MINQMDFSTTPPKKRKERKERDQEFLFYCALRKAWTRRTFCLKEKQFGWVVSLGRWGRRGEESGEEMVIISKYYCVVCWGHEVFCDPDERALSHRSELAWSISQINSMHIIAPQWLLKDCDYSSAGYMHAEVVWTLVNQRGIRDSYTWKILRLDTM